MGKKVQLKERGTNIDIYPVTNADSVVGLSDIIASTKKEPITAEINSNGYLVPTDITKFEAAVSGDIIVVDTKTDGNAVILVNGCTSTPSFTLSGIYITDSDVCIVDVNRVALRYELTYSDIGVTREEVVSIIKDKKPTVTCTWTYYDDKGINAHPELYLDNVADISTLKKIKGGDIIYIHQTNYYDPVALYVTSCEVDSSNGSWEFITYFDYYVRRGKVMFDLNNNIGLIEMYKIVDSTNIGEFISWKIID